MTNIIEKIKYEGLLMGAMLVLLSIIPFSSVLGANVFNSNPADYPLRVGNSTQNQGTQNWQTSLTGVNAGDALEFSVYFHNASDIPATNTNVRLQLSPAGSSTSFTTTSTISATNFNDYTTSVSIALTSSQSIQFRNTAKLYSNYNGSNYQIRDVPVTVSGNVLTYNLGTVNPGYAPNDGYIIFYAQVSKPQNPPIVSAGPNKIITSGQSTILNGTASHPDGLSMTYQWSCNGGRLSSTTILQPTFYAPNVSSTQTYSCTLTAIDTNNKIASSVVYITVNPIAIQKPNVFNSNPADYPLRVGNSTQNQGTQNWQTSLTGVNAGDALEFSVYFHNASDIPATNTNVRLQLSPAGSSTSFTTTSTISATNFSDYTTSVSIALTSSQSIQFRNTAKLYSNYNGSNYQIRDVPVTVSGNVLTYNLGTVNPGYAPNDGYIIFYAQVSAPQNPPVVSAGPNKTITSGQSTILNGTASHPDGLSMTYQWSCNGGSLSSTTILQPTFYAPNVSSTQTYSCTLTARDTNNKTASSVVYITVNPVAIQNPPVVSAGPNKTITSGQSTILNGTASHPDGLSMTYQWSCNGGRLSSTTILQPTFYAPNVSSTQTYSCTLTARDTNNKTASSVVYITVNPVAIQNPPIVSAGPNKTITSGQSTILNGTASHPDGLSMTYQWSCNGGRLSSTTILQPTFYAPNVSSTQTYSCTLTARDTNNKTASSVVYITVNPIAIQKPNVFNSNPADYPLRVGNSTQNQGTQKWQTSLTGVNAGDALEFSVYFHNASDIPATNTNVRLQLSPAGSSTSFTTTSTISATNFNDYTTSVSIALTSSQSIQFRNTAKLYSNYNGSNYQIRDVPVTVSGNVLTYDLGTVNPGYAPNDGYIIFYAQVSKPQNPPIVSAGPNKTITSGQSTILNGTASHPDGLSMTYQWSCNGGSLSSTTTLQPTFYAPNVSSTQTYSCTLTARDTNNKTASSVVYITVNPVAIQNPPVVSAGPNKTITSGQSTILNGTASHPDGLSMTYQWSCNGGSLSSTTILQPTFYAPNVSSTQTYSCTLTARDTNNKTASSVVYITVNPTSSPITGYPSVNAGPNKIITSGQSTILEGSATHSSGLLMTYQWSCNGGSLSNSTTLQPTFYAPNVSSTQTYSCTLTARDSNNNTASSVVYITVNPSYYSGGSIPVVNAGPNKTIVGGQSITLEGTAYHPNNLYMTYQWSCNGGSLSNSTTLQPTFYAPNVSSTQTYSCTLTARDTNNNTASSVVYITVNPSYYSGGSIPVVNAGPNKTIVGGQSITLEGTAYHPNNLYMTYQWSCNGGSLSNSTTLQPTFYAPNVSSTQTYSCTLTARDSNNNTASSVVYITVNPSGQVGGDFLVSTHLAENITSTSATLKGKIDNDYGKNISVRFNWGPASSQYTNYSQWQYNKRTGDIVSLNVTGLQKGKAYHYRLEASDGSRTVYGKDVSFITKTDPVSNFTALAAGSNKINLTWNSAPGSCYTMIVKKTGGYPQHGADGTIIYYGTGNSYLDTDVSNNLWYYYKAWAVGCDQGLISFSNSVQSRAYTVSDQVTPVTPTTPVEPIVTTVSGVDVEFFARNVSKDQFSWQNSIIAEPKDKIDFKIIITPTGNKSLENVKLVTNFSNKITSIDDIVVDGSTFYFDLNKETSFGTIKLGESRTITFTGVMDDFNNQIVNSIEVSAKGIDTVRKDLSIDRANFQQGASFVDIFGSGIYIWLIIILIVLMVLLIMYLILERNKMLKEKEGEVKVEKSKYFNIK